MSNTIPVGFVGYASRPAHIGEAIRAAVDEINAGKTVYLKTWEQIGVGGRVLIDAICKEIDKADLFVADVTVLNANVLYELGYAIAIGRRIWLLADRSFESAGKDWKEFSLLATVGYSNWLNTASIVSAFYSDRPHETLGMTIRAETIEPTLGAAESDGVLYLKPIYGTNAAHEVSRRLDQTKATGAALVIDDPRESAQTLTWYAQQVWRSRAVVCHFDHPDRSNASVRNARVAFVAGLAHGFGRPMLMLAEGDYVAPLDYKDRLTVYQTASVARARLDDWISPLEASWTNDLASRVTHSAKLRLAMELKSLQLGEYVAENEEEMLRDGYFVETAQYNEAVNGTTRSLLFVGAKGSGKTANFVKIRATFEADRRNIVCAIRPAFYDLSALINVLNLIAGRERKAHVIEALWRLLVYGEIVRTVQHRVQQKDPSARTPAELAFLGFVESESGLFDGDFAVRMERSVKSLRSVEFGADASTEAFQQRVATVLNHSVLPRLRHELAAVLPRRGSVVVLVDNLDKSWERDADLSTLADFLFGLLRAATKISDEVKADLDNAGRAMARIILFLRTDIFDRLIRNAREPDKLRPTRLQWDTPELLLRVVDERLVASQSSGTEEPPEKLWARWFCPSVDGMPVREYVTSVVLPKPRDLLFLIKESIVEAVNRGHGRVESEDLKSAARKYSEFAFEVLRIEDASTEAPVADGLIFLAGECATVDEHSLKSCLQQGLTPERYQAAEVNWQDIVRRFVLSGFLSIRVGDDDYRRPDGDGDYDKVLVMATKFARQRGAPIQYRIHRAFRAYLELSPD